ncbi:hypothetical protein Hypma_013559 [Hypsizygus marmoreus]|uniref:Fungal-type protein kinase domain-containing protein n=1 Tax=Hypsizygus marmoreus TaxID=39966 RepID=A0A369JDD3_HYPMA|nr:hypothetical protein Hypma_013559 [Hypsizygus marmoreus]
MSFKNIGPFESFQASPFRHHLYRENWVPGLTGSREKSLLQDLHIPTVTVEDQSMEKSKKHKCLICISLSWIWDLEHMEEFKLVFGRTLRERIPRWKDHLPEISFSTTITAEELGLPRVQLSKRMVPTDFRFEDQRMHAIAGALYEYSKLWQVDNVVEFEQVFLDCVECHYHAFNDGKVLHRDLSENDLMFKRKGGEVKGILNDWDMASSLNAINKVQNSTAKHRTGTLPFMARELLVDKTPPTHLYRHDLESFFYILVWAVVHYDLKKKKHLPVAKPLRDWDDNGSVSKGRNAKSAFINDGDVAKEVLEHALPEFQETVSKWVMPMLRLFVRAIASKRDNGHDEGYDLETCGGTLTFQTFMGALNRVPRQLV